MRREEGAGCRIAGVSKRLLRLFENKLEELCRMGSGVGQARWLDIARPESKAGCVVEGLTGDSFSSCLTNNNRNPAR